MAFLHSPNLASLTQFNLCVPCLWSVENGYPMSISFYKLCKCLNSKTYLSKLNNATFSINFKSPF